MAEVTDEVPISHLQRRRIESRVLIPFIAACRECASHCDFRFAKKP